MYVLTHDYCDKCVWSKHGFYNPTCAHCPYCTYSKDLLPSFIPTGLPESIDPEVNSVKEVIECNGHHTDISR